MAIVHCPACGKRISSLAQACPHCHEATGQLDQTERQRLEFRRWRDRIYRAQNLAHAAMAIVVFGLLGWWLAEPRGLTLPIASLPLALMSAGLVGYAVSWGWLLWLRYMRDPRK